MNNVEKLKKYVNDFKSRQNTYKKENVRNGDFFKKRKEILKSQDPIEDRLIVQNIRNVFGNIIEEIFPFYSKLDIKIMQSTKIRFLSKVTVTYYFMNKKCCYRYTIPSQDLERDVRELGNQLRCLRYEGGIL